MSTHALTYFCAMMNCFIRVQFFLDPCAHHHHRTVVSPDHVTNIGVLLHC